MIDFIAKPLGQFLNIIYQNFSFSNYGIAIIIFTFMVKTVLLPLSVKAAVANTRLQQLQPKIQELQARYKNDKETLNKEMVKFYQENSVNPAGGCLPLLIQMPIIFALLRVVGRPLTFMLQTDQSLIANLATKVPVHMRIANYAEIGIINYQHTLAKPEISNINFDFFGINLGLIPSYNYNLIFSNLEYLAVLIIPILATVATFYASKLGMAATPNTQANSQQANMAKKMLWLGPAMTLIFSFQFPAGLGLYWAVGSLYQVLQQLYINKYILGKKEVSIKK